MSTWTVYVLKCDDDSLYTGITTDIIRRVKEHNSGTAGKGAKCTSARRPVQLVYSEECEDRSTASKREWAIKQLSRSQKLLLIKTP
jgi:putative endonuclease